MVDRPAVTSAAIPEFSRKGTTRVRAGPMLLGQGPCAVVENAEVLGGGEIGNVDDQGIEAGPTLGRVDARDGVGVGSVGGEAVDGLGRHRDRLAGEHEPRGLGDRLGTERKRARVVWRGHPAGAIAAAFVQQGNRT